MAHITFGGCQEVGERIYLPLRLLWKGVRDDKVYDFEKAVKDDKVYNFTEKDVENVSPTSENMADESAKC